MLHLSLWVFLFRILIPQFPVVLLCLNIFKLKYLEIFCPAFVVLGSRVALDDVIGHDWRGGR